MPTALKEPMTFVEMTAMEMEKLRAEIARWRPLSPPTEQARQVFTKTLLNTPDADMRAVPNQWLLNQRGLSEKVAHDLEAEIETLHAEIARLREALQSISGLYWTDAPCPQEMRDIAAAALKEKP